MSARHATFHALLAATLAATSLAHAQDREPLCTPVESRRLLAGPSLDAPDGERMVAAPFATAGSAGERFVVAVRDPSHALHAGDAMTLARGIDALELAHPWRREARPAGLVVLRLGDDLRPLGEPAFVPDPGLAPDAAPRPAALPVAVTLPSGVLVLQLVGGAVDALMVPAHGPIGTPAQVAPSPAGGFVWLTAVARGRGAIALAGGADGLVVAMRFTGAGALEGTPGAWPQPVGGAIQLLPIEHGPLAALLARPVHGTGLGGEAARVQALLEIDEARLLPTAAPVATGFAQFPLAYATRGRTVMIFQWVREQGVAIATMPVGDRHVAVELPRLWYAQPPLEGGEVGHAATLGPGHIVYDAVTYADAQGGLHGHIAWVPPSGVPVVRRDVLPVRARLAAPPVVLPAADGVVVFTAGSDETGGAIDAWHVRCELVTP